MQTSCMPQFSHPKTGNFVYHLQTGSNIPLFVSDARTGFVAVNMVIFLASQFSFSLYLFTDRIQCWKHFLKGQPCQTFLLLLAWFCQLRCVMVCSFLLCLCRRCAATVDSATCTEF